MLGKKLLFRLAGLCAATALFSLGCAGAVSNRGAGEESGLSDEEFVTAIKRQIDYLVTCEDAMEDIEAVRGSVVKWNGYIVRMWDDKIQIRNQGEEERWNNFIVLLDHPLPRETRIGDMTQTVKAGNAVYVVGKIIDRQNVVLKSGADFTAPHLKGYVISKDNDRNLANPVWVRHK